MAARVLLPKTIAPGGYSDAGLALTWTAAADPSTTKNYFISTGKELVIARNSNAGVTARTVTIESIANVKHRTRDITDFSIAAGATAVFGPFPKPGWVQLNGQIYLQGSHAEVLFAVVVLP
jgi:hypothetical protein